MNKTSNKNGRVNFSGHETFVFRYAWLKKAVDAVQHNPKIMGSDAAMVELGVGRNMVKSIRHWATATEVLEEVQGSRGRELAVSKFGNFIFGESGWDRYSEDMNTLWLLHWKLVSNQSRATTWNWAFNLLHTSEFSKEELAALIHSELNKRNLSQPSQVVLKRDIECFIRTYAPSRGRRGRLVEESLDCPLTELEVLEEDASSKLFHWKRGPQRSLNDETFVYAMLDFWNKKAPGRETLSFTELAYGSDGVGSLFRIDELSLVERLERLEMITDGALAYIETAGLKQVYRRRPIVGEELLESYYATHDPRIELGVL